MLNEYTKSAVKKLIDEEYPHLKYPAAIKARVTAMSKISDEVWLYNIRPVRNDLSDLVFPEIPNIKSHVEVEAGVGGIVAVALLYGSLDPIIIDEVIP